MRIVSWNLNRATWQHRKRFTTSEDHRQGGWTQLAALDPDIALVQEAAPPPDGLERPPLETIPSGEEEWRSLPGPQRTWCAAIASWGPRIAPIDSSDRTPLDVTHRGAYAIGTVAWRNTRLALVSIYALWDYAWLPTGYKPRPRYAETSLHRSISDLTPILDFRHNGMPVLLAGDFNASTQHDEPYRAAYRIVHERIKAFGLVNVSVAEAPLDNCRCADETCRHLRGSDELPYQLDYMYASPDVAAALRFVNIQRTDAIDRVSDHHPLIGELAP